MRQVLNHRLPTIAMAAIAMAVALFSLVGYLLYTRSQPARGYTSFGLLLGVIGTGMVLVTFAYLARRRWLQEVLPWSLATWLQLHLWLSLAGLWFLFLHAGFHFDGGSGSWASGFLFATLATGVAGWLIYRIVPGHVAGTVQNLATGHVRQEIEQLNQQVTAMAAGRGSGVAQLADAVVAGTPLPHVRLDDEAAVHANEVRRLGETKSSLQAKLREQLRYKRWLRGWLIGHLFFAFGFMALIAVHAYDAMELKWYVTSAGPHDFADPARCANCHVDHFEEWEGSMHAIAQLSPVTDLQNRLVVLKDRFDEGKFGVTVGDLCVKCHAPTSRLGSSDDLEDELIAVDDRAPASHFGVSCVACHQIENIHKSQPFDEDTDRVDYKNAENLAYTEGRTMHGPLGESGFSVGNSEHKGTFRDHFSDSSFCASCHTVMVDPEGPDNLVTLQNTYKEWLDGGDENRFTPVNWSKLGINCLDCHGKPLEPLVQLASKFQAERLPLAQRRDLMLDAVKANRDRPLPTSKQFAAKGIDDFDQSLTPVRTHLHTFTGVDYHLEDDLPYRRGHPRNQENPRIQAETVRQVDNLLKIAAAMRIVDDGFASGSMQVDVLNLATGHHLPAGFAFAREMWIEVSVSERSSGESFTVVAGGKQFRPLRPSEMLDKYGEGASGKLKNFQAVLWNGDQGGLQQFSGTTSRRGETVLQNECVKVLKGADAVRNGFPDRENFLLPGEIRRLKLNVDPATLRAAKRVRVRLLFRNYPPEFLDQLADRFLTKRDRYPAGNGDGPAADRDMWEPDPERAQRTRDLIGKLRIFEIARDEISFR